MTRLLDIPKVDLHTHGNGMLTDRDCVRMAAENGIALPYKKPGQKLGSEAWIDEKGQRHWNTDDHASFHEAYDATVAMMPRPQDLGWVVLNHLLTAADEGCIYTEVLASCSNNYRKGGNHYEIFQPYARCILDAMYEAERRRGIKATLVITGKRHMPPSEAMDLLDSVALFKKSGLDPLNKIVGFNAAGNEETFAGGEFAEVFRRAHEGMKLGCTIHAGEVHSAHDVAEAIKLPGVTRIGHGLSAVHSQPLMDELARRGILLEICLTSNERLHPRRFREPADHPITIFADNGMAFNLNTDDAGILGCSIGYEYFKARSEYGFSDAHLLLATIMGLRHAFADNDTKHALLMHGANFGRANQILLPERTFDLSSPIDLKDVMRNLPARAAMTRSGGGRPELRQ